MHYIMHTIISRFIKYRSFCYINLSIIRHQIDALAKELNMSSEDANKICLEDLYNVEVLDLELRNAEPIQIV